MQPVLNYLQSKLKSQDVELLSALVTALSTREAVGKLDVFDSWREARPQPLE